MQIPCQHAQAMLEAFSLVISFVSLGIGTIAAWAVWCLRGVPLARIAKLELTADDLRLELEALNSSHRRLLSRVSMQAARERRAARREPVTDEEKLAAHEQEREDLRKLLASKVNHG